MSLFGAPGQTSGGLFGNTQQQQQPQQQQQANTAPQGVQGLWGTFKPSPLGGSVMTPSNNSTQTGTGTTNTQPATGGLFGATATTNAPTGGLFGNQTTGLFDASTRNAGLGAAGTQSTAQQQQGTSQSTASYGAYFDSLLEKNKKQAEGETALGDLPSLQLGLGDLRQKLRKLGPTTGKDRPVDGRAHYFLAASGVDPGAAVKDLGSFGLQARAERPQGTSYNEVDVETYLSNLQTKTTLSMISDGLERSVRDFDRFLEDNVTMEWEAQRQRIYQHFGIKPREEAERGATPGRDSQGGFGRSRRKAGQAQQPQKSTQRASILGRSAMQRSVLGTPSRIGSHAPEFSDVETAKDGAGAASNMTAMEDRFLRDKQGKLADIVHAFNDARQQGQRVYIFDDLAKLESTGGNRHTPYILEAYKAMMEIVGEFPDDNPAPKERQFAAAYADPNPQSPESVSVRTRILKGANQFLEKQFYKEVNEQIAKYPQDANLGGQPDVVSKIKAYIRLRQARKTLQQDGVELQQLPNGDYIWAVVFYLLRGGFVTEAAQYVNSNENHFRSIDRTFSGYINSYASSEERRLRRQMQDRCMNEYIQRLRNAPEGSVDPYRVACYKIIGRCDVTNRSLDNIQTDVTDWIWLQFNLAREGDRSRELAAESYGLAELQSSIREIGLKHFPKTPAEDKNSAFGMYFYLQILSGMFEQAIAYLYPFSYVDAVHFSIALTYYGLLRPADANSSGNELLSLDTRGRPQINFGRMLGYYTRDFRAANASAAVDYLVLICLNATDSPQQASLCHEALRELVLETREFSKLIGDIKPDGTRIKGTIEERGSLIALGQEADFIRAITLQAATFADDNGRTTDAVLLYHLAGDYDTVVSIVSRALSEAISLEIGEDPLKLIPVRPRVEGREAEQVQPGSSLSLAAIDDPVELAKTMMTMYERDRMFWRKIREPNRIACSVLLQMSDIKKLVEEGKWPQCLDRIKNLEILPLEARGDPTTIRQYAARFASLSQPVAINVPNLLMWTLICCTKQRERLTGGNFLGDATAARGMIDEMKTISVDLTTYTSQLRYRLPPSLHEALARASAD
ncbi:putative nuclear pore protein [Rhypophila sp. PSN 637]